MKIQREERELGILQGARMIFWDFDGVIKDSVSVKSLAFEHLFIPYGLVIANRVRQHHEANGGVSRFDKMPIYLDWAGEYVTKEKVQEFCDRFSGMVQQAVIDSAWVPGVYEYLMARYSHQQFVLITATPQHEIRQILAALDIERCFHEVHGAPTTKAAAIGDVLTRLQCPPGQALVIGDAETDFDAANANHVPFLLRRTSLNQGFQGRFKGPSFEQLDLKSFEVNQHG